MCKRLKDEPRKDMIFTRKLIWKGRKDKSRTECDEGIRPPVTHRPLIFGSRGLSPKTYVSRRWSFIETLSLSDRLRVNMFVQVSFSCRKISPTSLIICYRQDRSRRVVKRQHVPFLCHFSVRPVGHVSRCLYLCV